MYLIRNAQTGWVSCYAEESDEANVPAEVLDGYERVDLDVSHDEFEAAAREDAGLAEDEPLGVLYVKDEPAIGSQAFGAPSRDSPGKPGKRVGHKRVKAYAPVNPVTELMNELGKNSRQSVSWGEVERIMEMIRGDTNV